MIIGHTKDEGVYAVTEVTLNITESFDCHSVLTLIEESSDLVQGGFPNSKCCGNCLSQLGEGKGTKLYFWQVIISFTLLLCHENILT